MKTIVFLHGFFASGACAPAEALREYFAGKVRVLSPDLPLHPNDVLSMLEEYCQSEHADLLVGNSCGSFYGQMVAQKLHIPALLGNPHLQMTEFLPPRLGAQEYKTPRQNGKQQFVITEELVGEFAELEKRQFDGYDSAFAPKIWGLFGETDTIAHFEPLFRQYYSEVYHFPGGHSPSQEEVKQYYAPLAEKMLRLYSEQ